MWNFRLWKSGALFGASQGLWKSVKYSTDGCGKKVVAAVREIGLFHITFLYYC
jgi:hypothetical protein